MRQEHVGTEGAATFATVTRRRGARSTGRITDRSKSRAAKRNKKSMEGRQAENMSSFVLQEKEGKTITEVRDLVWTQAMAKIPNSDD